MAPIRECAVGLNQARPYHLLAWIHRPDYESHTSAVREPLPTNLLSTTRSCHCHIGPILQPAPDGRRLDVECDHKHRVVIVPNQILPIRTPLEAAQG